MVASAPGENGNLNLSLIDSTLLLLLPFAAAAAVDLATQFFSFSSFIFNYISLAVFRAVRALLLRDRM